MTTTPPASEQGTGADGTQPLESTTESEAIASNAEQHPRLSFFIPDLSLGGAEQVTVTIVNGLAERGYDVELLLSRRTGELEHRLSERVHVVEFGPTEVPGLGVATHLPALVRYLRDRQPAALFPHLEHVSVVCLAAKAVFDLDTVVVPTQHKSFGTAPDPRLKSRLVKGLTGRLYPYADRVIAVSEGVADSMAAQMPVDRDDISVLYNPIDIETIRRRALEPVDDEWIEADDVPVVVFVGRHEAQKDLETWLDAFERVHEANPEVRGILVGKGSQRESLRELAEERGLGDVVAFPGYVDNPYRYMHNASAFMLSSRYEGLPTVLIEALACGCPIVATDCPSGPKEILLDGELGPLAPVGDSERLAEGVLDVLDDPVDADRLRERAEAFSPEAVIDNYERFIETYVVPE